jgi:DNA sulfur modification protein DndD
MLLTEFSAENLGVFKGKHVFDLRTVDTDKPIIIFGGRNGAGKTTLFEGIRLCLYGASFHGGRLNKSEYHEYLRSRIHHQSGLAESEGAYVALEFEHVQQGVLSKYRVRRRWHCTPDTVNETLEVLRDGSPIDEIVSQQLQDFLMELIPLGLSRLFFFDGEEIQKLAEDQVDNRNLIDAFNALLGVDVLEQLQTDLHIHLTRQTRELPDKANHSYEALLQESKSLTAELTNLRHNRAQKQTEIDHMTSQIERKEHDLASEGGGFADRRQQLKSRKADVETEIEALESAVRELSSSLLPFAISPTLCRSLKDRILSEERQKQELAAARLLETQAAKLKERLEGNEFWSGITVDQDSRNAIIARLLGAFRLETPLSTPKLVHELSQGDQQRILKWIDQSLNDLPLELQTITAKLESKTRELHEIEETLRRAPPDEAISPIVQELNEFHERLGGLNREIHSIEENVRQTEFKLRDNERRIAKSLEEEHRTIAIRERIELGKRVEQALKEFAEALRKQKTKEIAERFVQVFNQLSTKKNLVSRVDIDPESFSVTLYRQDGTRQPKEALSAGEKEVYAIAMLTALAKTSRKPLPFIIDTPLARLDSEHRTNLVDGFFPSASHQVLVFSTDTEIDGKYFEELRLHVSRCYLLTYDEPSQASVVSSGYFWEKPPEIST